MTTRSRTTKDQNETAVITPTARVTAREARPRRLTSSLLWAAQILLAAFFLFAAAAPKLSGSHSAVQEFGLIGAGRWLRYIVGAAELAGAIGLLTPWLAGLAAAGLAADMAGATIVNATVLHNTTYGINVWMTGLLSAVFVLLAYGRRQQMKGLAAASRQRAARRPNRHKRENPGMAHDLGFDGLPFSTWTARSWPCGSSRRQSYSTRASTSAWSHSVKVTALRSWLGTTRSHGSQPTGRPQSTLGG